MTAPSPPRRLRIDRLDLDLRGIAPATAQATAQALGPALARALATHGAHMGSAEHIDAGRMASPADPGANSVSRHADGSSGGADPGFSKQLAVRIAQRIADAARRGRP